MLGTGLAITGCDDAPVRDENVGGFGQPQDQPVTSQTDYRGGDTQDNISPSRAGAGAQDNVPPTGATPADADQYVDGRQPDGEGYQAAPGQGGAGAEGQPNDFSPEVLGNPQDDEFVQGQDNLRPGFQGIDTPDNSPVRRATPEE